MRRAFERSEITSRLVRYLAANDKGSRIPYDELSRAAGFIVTPHTTFLTSARKILEREFAQVWVCIAPAVCLYRLNDPEIADRQRSWFLSGAKNKLSAGARQADVVELDKLNLGQQARFATELDYPGDCARRSDPRDATEDREDRARNIERSPELLGSRMDDQFEP